MCSFHGWEGKDGFLPPDELILSTDCETEGVVYFCALRYKIHKPFCDLICRTCFVCGLGSLLAKGRVARELIPSLMSLSE